MASLARKPIADTELLRRQSRRSEDLTFALLARLSIRPKERALVALLGVFTARNNHTALRHWTDQQIGGLPVSVLVR